MLIPWYRAIRYTQIKQSNYLIKYSDQLDNIINSAITHAFLIKC